MDRLERIRLGVEIKRVETLMANPGMYRIVGVDRFSGEDWVEDEYRNKGIALLVARTKTRSCMKLASDYSVATVFYVYDDEGNYLGGDVWNGR